MQIIKFQTMLQNGKILCVSFATDVSRNLWKTAKAAWKFVAVNNYVIKTHLTILPTGKMRAKVERKRTSVVFL